MLVKVKGGSSPVVGKSFAAFPRSEVRVTGIEGFCMQHVIMNIYLSLFLSG